MKLEQLLEGVSYTLVQGSLELDIEDIIYDSRKAAPGRLFVCIVVPSGTATTTPPSAWPTA
jgi:UDP-N-acetylmuramoyl-L-alanyl-D-glutamate--2,6-diaminopimelate ligase